ncbi:tetratricopeptide repeat protein (plasmid) [Streptomyces sp. NBC_00445]|uniref:tetratricopeptide repeat protein n=1 Tax=Streptomyces sp. NBC_00445 TaxID=2975745 RepID=UPI002E1E07F6
MSSSLDAHPDLPPSTARVYRLLSLVFPDDIDAGLTAAVCRLPAGQAVQTLRQLSSVDLLESLGRQRGRDSVYRFHHRARQHARSLAAAEEPSGTKTEVTRRALDWYLLTTTVCERLVTPAHPVLDREISAPDILATPLPDETTALAWLQAQHTNLMEAIRIAHRKGLYATTWQLVHAMWPWFHRMHDYNAWFEAHELGFEAAWRCGHRLAQRILLNTWGVGLRSDRQLERALEVFEQVHHLAVADDDQRTASQALHEIGNVHLDAGRLAEAEHSLRQARVMRTALGYEPGVALTDICLGRVAFDSQDYARATDIFRAAFGALVAEHWFDAARALAWLGASLAQCGDFAEAEQCLRHAGKEFAAHGSDRWTARSAEMFGDALTLQGRTGPARDHYLLALTLYEPISPRDAGRVRTSLQTVSSD